MLTLKTLETLYSADRAAYLAAVEAAFELVKPLSHWKAPIKTTASKAALAALGMTPEAIAYAVLFYTATECKVVETPTEVTFTAPGYWAGPAN